MTRFRSPIRREVRQRSGFKVTDETSGGECKIKISKSINFNTEEATLYFEKKDVTIPTLFGHDTGIVAFGGYLNSLNNVNLRLDINTISESRTSHKTLKKNLEGNRWYNVGIFDKIKNLDQDGKNVNILVNIKLYRKDKIGKVNFYGFELSPLIHQDYIDNLSYQDDTKISDKFHQKTGLCVPYLFYFNHEDPLPLYPYRIKPLHSKFIDGIPVLLKSCNRCGRYLLIEYEKEKQRNLISYGNHCVKNAPCEHGSFGKQKIIEDECKKSSVNKPQKLKEIITHNGSDSFTNIYYGYQLECKACKKFYVNAALNPMRNSTQHREDSLRRRAIEVLVDILLENEWIYHKYRRLYGKEFDTYIWKKFEKKCFNCGKDIESCNKMHLDHTMPLSALWPLDDNATCLCSKCNNEKHDKFPIEFYNKNQIDKLIEITDIEKDIIYSKKINQIALDKLIVKIEWFFDVFLTHKDYQKIRGGKKTADLIYKSIQKQIEKSEEYNIDLIEVYKNKKGKYPESITLNETIDKYVL